MGAAVELILVICFLGDAEACLTMSGPQAATRAACEAAAPDYVRLWAEGNPGWQVAQWSCAPAPKDA